MSELTPESTGCDKWCDRCNSNSIKVLNCFDTTPERTGYHVECEDCQSFWDEYITKGSANE